MRQLGYTLALAFCLLPGAFIASSATVRSVNYLEPSSYELVVGADAVVRAVALDTTVVLTGYKKGPWPDKGAPIYSRRVRFRMLEVVKGAGDLDTITIEGHGRSVPPGPRQDTLLGYMAQALEKTRGAHRWRRLRALVSMPGLPDQARYWTIDALRRLKYRGEKEAEELLDKIGEE